ncbi:MAG TPA: sulfur carrier protein ThiS [Paucimonas sp.]|nr:sulfur carrier protein ThiS [Paucimonas sp.]
MMEIELNGAPHAVADSQSVQELIASLDLLGKSLAVAINREVVPRRQWPERMLQPADRVDIVRAIGGG